MKLLERNKAENARAYALRVLNYNIVTLELEPGAPMSENELSAALGLSRTPVREALIELSKSKLVDIVPKKGSYVSKIDYDLIEEAGFIRCVLEEATLKIVCREITVDMLGRLKENLEQQRSCLDGAAEHDRLFALDNEFHRLLFEAADKLYAYEIVKMQMKNFDRLRALSLKAINQARNVRDHENVVYAIERRDEELACMVMERHLNRYNFDRKTIMEKYPDYFK